jgi:anti-sigma factor RsiW
MDERDAIRLMEWLDGRLDPEEAAEVEAWLERDPEAARLAAEHRAVWSALGAVDLAENADDSDAFRERTVARARAAEQRVMPRLSRAAMLVAASLLVAVSLFVLMRPSSPPWARLTDEEREIVQNLDLIEALDVLEQYGSELDLAVQVEILQAFDGELGESR